MADHGELISIINELRSKRKGQYYENIIDIASNTYNWNDDLLNKKLEEAENDNIIKRCPVGNKISYRLVREIAMISNNAVNATVQTDFNNLVPEYHEVNFQVNDYIDFKKHVLDEISILKESLKSSSDLNVNSEYYIFFTFSLL